MATLFAISTTEGVASMSNGALGSAPKSNLSTDSPCCFKYNSGPGDGSRNAAYSRRSTAVQVDKRPASCLYKSTLFVQYIHDVDRSKTTLSSAFCHSPANGRSVSARTYCDGGLKGFVNGLLIMRIKLTAMTMESAYVAMPDNVTVPLQRL